MITKLAAYVVMGINEDGRKEVLTIEVGENESSKYWLGVLGNMKVFSEGAIKKNYIKLL